MVAYTCLQLRAYRLYQVSSGHFKAARLHSEGKFVRRCLLVRTRTYGCNAASHRKAPIYGYACDRMRKWGVSAGRRHRDRLTTALKSPRPQERCLHPLNSSNLPTSTIARVSLAVIPSSTEGLALTSTRARTSMNGVQVQGWFASSVRHRSRSIWFGRKYSPPRWYEIDRWGSDRARA